jgi:hypothetical protein
MNRRAASLWMRTLLPLLVLRLLLPTGLMLAPGEHGVALVLCSMDAAMMRAAGAEAPASAQSPMPGMDMSRMDMSAMSMDAAAAPAHATSPAHSHPDQSNAHKDAVCPFAAAATPAPLAAQSFLAQRRMTSAAAVLARTEPQRTARSGPVRSQISRAPPALS